MCRSEGAPLTVLGRIALFALAGCVTVGAALAWRLLSHPALEPFAALELRSSPVAPGGLRVRWMGVSTLLFDDGETQLLVDGFFSRPGPLQVLGGAIAPDEERIDAALRRAGIARLAAVLVAHSHYDHALDAPVVARKTGAVQVFVCKFV